MSGYPYRLQAIGVGLLVLAWLGFCSPWSVGVNLLLAALTVGMATAAIVLLTRRARAQRRATSHTLAVVDHALRALPSEVRRHTPLVITVGDAHAMASAWGDDVARMTDAALWVRCDTSLSLMHLADALKRWRGGQGPDAVAVLIAADQGDANTQAATAWKPWHSAMRAASRAVGYALPLCIAVYAEAVDEDIDAYPWTDAYRWFGVSGGAALDIQALPDVLAPELEQYVRAVAPTRPETRAHRAALLDALMRWTRATVLPIWTDRRAPWRVTACGVTTVPGVPMPGAPFSHFVAQTTGLVDMAVERRVLARYPLPDALLAGMPRQPVRRAWPRALAHAVIAVVVFFVAGAMASAWQNRALMQRVADHITRYQALPMTQDAARVDALASVKRDRDELEHYADVGVPMRLGFGLYRGAPWLPVVNRLIAGYEPPAPPPSMIELDSLSLFKSGSAVLNPGSNRVLVVALDMIKAHPDKRVLVAGHTDAVGNAVSNQKLSEARAAAVRDWLIDASGLSPTRFAIQGYGDTRPKASNDTAAGRAMNRRVEITLIPDCRDDDGSRSTQGRPACSR
ncbi:OmpA family protein [Dyella sp.]|uniref:OmpA family protein n=1 Tax=Dyella sp. TaxID=1869338 RepID=UPI002D78758E|nr:OmpA family protein [Dyella sp.]HET7329209.1 OmpA family protein [Dyella sp.]